MLTALDVGFGLLLLISAILATARGLTREVLSLVTWLGSAALAAYMYFKHPDIAQTYIKEPIVANIATVVVTFIVALVVLHLITMRIADFVVDSRIGALDRTLGFVYGILRGLVIAVVVVIFGLWLLTNQLPSPTTQIDYSRLPSWAAESQSLPYLTNFGTELMSALPHDVEEQLTSFLRHGSPAAPTDETEGDDADASPNDTTPAPGASPETPAPDNGSPALAPAPQAPAAPPAAPAAPAANPGA